MNIHQCSDTECGLFAKPRAHKNEWLRVRVCNSNRSPQSGQILLNYTKNKTLGHVLSNNGLYMSTQHTQYMLLLT